jgi:hypothetical protein
LPRIPPARPFRLCFPPLLLVDLTQIHWLQMLMSNMREAEERLEYWRLKYGLNDQDLDRYRYYLNEDDDDWLDM